MSRRFPFSPNPVGWFAVAYSDELAPSAIVPIHYFGKELVLFRTAQGQAVVLDAYCPHLGANLGDGGEVAGETIRCPFHAWCFDQRGACVEVPYAARLPRAQVRSWPVCERNGFILVHHHPAGELPTFEIPSLPEFGSSDWTPYARRRWRIRTDVREMTENAFDRAHFRYLHHLKNLPEPRIVFEGPRFHIEVRTEMQTDFGVIDGTLEMRSAGPGFGTGRFRGLIETLLISTVTPIDDEYVDARFTFTVRKLPDEGATRLVGDSLIAELSHQVEQDIRIWEKKVYCERPVLCREDSAIAAFRTWSKQFYPTSPSLKVVAG
jgi:phenylpropionate dioxygenase-like ring-hydroxylating dioxygenase large terminal subunit